jgi:hypothetical protein
MTCNIVRRKERNLVFKNMLAIDRARIITESIRTENTSLLGTSLLLLN